MSEVVFVCVTQTFKFGVGFFGSDSGHVVLLSDRLGQHPLQPLQRGLALRCERRQTLVTGVEGGDVSVAVLWVEEESDSHNVFGTEHAVNLHSAMFTVYKSVYHHLIHVQKHTKNIVTDIRGFNVKYLSTIC